MSQPAKGNFGFLAKKFLPVENWKPRYIPLTVGVFNQVIVFQGFFSLFRYQGLSRGFIPALPLVRHAYDFKNLKQGHRCDFRGGLYRGISLLLLHINEKTGIGVI